MQLAVIINSVVCVVGVLGGLFLAGASIISIANMTVPWREWLILAALLVPGTFLVSGVGAWVASAQSASQVALGLIALPWAYAVIFVLLMLVSFKS